MVHEISISRSIFKTGSGFMGHAYGQIMPGYILAKLQDSFSRSSEQIGTATLVIAIRDF